MGNNSRTDAQHVSHATQEEIESLDKAPESCILCGARQREFLIALDPWKVYRCSRCKLGFLDPRPARTERQKQYEKEYFLGNYDAGLAPGSKELEKRLSGETHRVRFIKAWKPKGRLLDIGCGYGYFLLSSREKGYEVTGIDLSTWAAHHATEHFGLSVNIGQVGNVEYPAESFDIITMWHFLEHTEDPDLTVRKAGRWLKKDGILVIDVPNYESTDALHKWADWDGWCLPYHLWHFTPESLRAFLGKFGFEVVRSKHYHSDVIKKRLKAILPLRPFARIIAKWYSGSSVAVIAKPIQENQKR